MLLRHETNFHRIFSINYLDDFFINNTTVHVCVKDRARLKMYILKYIFVLLNEFCRSSLLVLITFQHRYLTDNCLMVPVMHVLCNKILQTGEWSIDWLKVEFILILKITRTAECQEDGTISRSLWKKCNVHLYMTIALQECFRLSSMLLCELYWGR